MKQTATILLAGVLALSLAACGAGGESSAEESGPPATSPSSASSANPSSSSQEEAPAISGLLLKLNSDAVLKPGDTATINVFLQPDTVPREDAVEQLTLVLDPPHIGTVSGPRLGDGTLQFDISGLTTGNAVATVQTKDGTVKSNALTIAVVAVDPLPQSDGESGVSGLSIALHAEQPLKPGDTATIQVFIESGDINQAADNLQIVLDNPQIGTVSGPRIAAGTLQYEISGLRAGNCNVTVQTTDGAVTSNAVTLAVAAV